MVVVAWTLPEVYPHNGHSEYLCSNIENFLRKNIFSDLVLISRNDDDEMSFHEFFVHKSLILPYSKLLYNLVNQHTRDPYHPSEIPKVFLEIETVVLRTILNLLYTGTIRVNISLLKKVTEALVLMGIDTDRLDFALWQVLDQSEDQCNLFESPPAHNLDAGKLLRPGIKRLQTSAGGQPSKKSKLNLDGSENLIQSTDAVLKSVKCALCLREFRYNAGLKIHMKKCSRVSLGKDTAVCVVKTEPFSSKVQQTTDAKKKKTNSQPSIRGFLTPSNSLNTRPLTPMTPGTKTKQTKLTDLFSPTSVKKKTIEQTDLASDYTYGKSTQLDNKWSIPLKCPKCVFTSPSLDPLKIHLATYHFSQHILAVNQDDFCIKCDKKFEDSILEHVALTHTHAIKFLLGKEKLVLPAPGTDKIEYEYYDVADYPVKPLKVDLIKIEVEILKQCFLCQMDLPQDRASCLLHFLTSTDHYKLEMQREFCKETSTWTEQKECPECAEHIPDQTLFIEHMAVVHNSLIKFIPHKYRIPPLVSESYTLPSGTESFTCPAQGCGTVRPDEMSLNVHIICSHLKTSLDADFKKDLKSGYIRCPIASCGMVHNITSTPTMKRLNFYKHIFSHAEIKEHYLEKI